MYTLAVLATLFAVANAGVIAGGISYASSPALGAPLLGSVSYSAPETTIVKQPVTIDQPEIRYRSVPVPVNVEVPSPPIVKTTVVSPAVSYAAVPAVSYAAAPALAYNTVGLGYNTVGLNSFTYNNAGFRYAGAPGLIL